MLKASHFKSILQVKNKAVEIGVLFVELNYYLNWLSFEIMTDELIQHEEIINEDLIKYNKALKYRLAFNGTWPEFVKEAPKEIVELARNIWIG